METADDIRSLFEERAAWAGADASETRALKRALAKKSDADIYEAIRRHAGVSFVADAADAEAILYSFTELQVISFAETLRILAGWD